LKSKFIVLTTLLAVAVLLPVSYVTADLYFDMTRASESQDGVTTGFTGLNGASGVGIFTNSSESKTYAVALGFLDDQLTLIDVTVPTNPVALDTIGQRVVGVRTLDDANWLDGPRNIAFFGNDTDTSPFTCTTARCETLGIVTNFQSDSVATFNFSASSERVYFLANYTEQDGTVPKVGFQPNIFKTFVQDGPNESTDQHSALDGPWDVATWVNSTSNTIEPATYAIVTAFNDDGVTIFNMTDPAGFLHVAMNLTNGVDGGGTAATDRPELELDGPTGVSTYYIQQSAGGPELPYAIITAFNDDGFQILDLSDPEEWFNKGDKAGYSGDGKARGGVHAAAQHSNATDNSEGFNLLDGAIDVATWNTTNTAKYGIVVAQNDNSFVVLDLSDPSARMFEKQLSNTSGAYGINWNITSPSAVTVFETDTNHYVAAIATNGTGSAAARASSVSLVDLYIPSNPQPLTTIVSDGGIGSDGVPFNLLSDAQSIETFYLAGVYYAAVTSYEDDAITIIQLNGDKPSSGGASKICGYNYDCEAPSVSKSGGSIAINNAALDTSSRYNDADTTTAKVGQMVTVKANVYDESPIYKSNLYFDFSGTSPDWNNANAAIKYTVSTGGIEIIDNNNIFSADVQENKVGDLTEIKFKIMFTDVMDTSHIAIQNIDDSTNYQLLYFKDALEVTGTPTQTSLDDVEGEVTQTATATVPGWVKNTAGWWASGAITEGEFVKGVEFLIKEQIIDTDAQTASSEGTGTSVPDWVKNTAGWWADGAISEGEFVNAIEHLVKTGTIIII